MSVSRPARCLLSTSSIPKIRPRVRCQNFHTSSTLCERRRPRFASIKASEIGLVTNKRPATEVFQRYTDAEKAALAQKYTPQQIKAIEAGEAAVDPEDLDNFGVIRSDLGKLPYLDDFSKTRSVIDRQPKYDGPMDPNAKFMSEREFVRSLGKTMAEIRAKKLPPPPKANPDDPDPPAVTRVDLQRGMKDMPMFMGSNDRHIPTAMAPSFLAPGLPRNFMADEEEAGKIKKPDAEDEVDPRDPDGVYNRLIKQSGLSLDQILDYKVKILVKHRVVNQTRLGKIASLYCLAVAGNGNGRLGLGEAKGQEIEETQNNARIAAIRSMQPIPRYEERTIFGEVEGKVSAVEVKLMSRPPGFGLRCQHNIFEMARAAGLQDLAARVPRSRNKMNTIKATYQALMKQRIPDEIARGRGKKLVDVRKVYYGGRV